MKNRKFRPAIFAAALLAVFVMLPGFAAAKDYKAAEIRTAASYMYGRFEARMLSSNKSGILSTLFTFNDNNFTVPQWNEIDIEQLGRYNDRVQFNVITYDHDMHEYVHYLSKNPSQCFITYAIEWAPSYVAWFIDGAEVYRDSGSHISELTFTQKFMLNHWATNLTAWAGAFDPASLPAYAFYDFASYYSYTPGAGNYGTGNNFTLQWKDDFNTFNTSRWQTASHTFDENVCDFIPQNAVIKDGHLVLAITDQYNTGFNGTIPQDCGPTPTFTRTRTPTPFAGTPTRTVTPSNTPSSVLLDDMEDGNNTNNWGGTWHKYQGSNSTLLPEPFSMTAGGMTGSANYRAQISGTINDYGGMGTTLLAGGDADLTNYIGIEFYARGNGGTYWFQFVQPSIPSSSGDYYGAVFTAPAAWTKVTILFSAIATRWGQTQPFTQNAVTAVQWANNSNGALDIQVDDVRFLMPAANTPTFTITATSTSTSSVLPTATRTATRTATTTNTPVPPTATLTRTATATNTPVPPAATFTRTATATNSPVPSSSATATAEYSATASFSSTPVVSATFTATASPTNSAVPPTVTFTGTATITNTAVVTPGNTPAGTLTNTPVVTVTFTATGTLTPYPLTPSFTPTQTNTIIVTPSNTPQGTVTSTPIVTATFTASRTATATLTPYPATPSFTGTATLTTVPSSTSTATPSRTATRTSTPSRTSTPTSTRTTVPNTPTITPTYTATSFPDGTVMKITKTGTSPNPVNVTTGSGMTVDFYVTKRCAKASFTLYTLSYRKIMTVGKTGPLNAGENIITITGAALSKLSPGVYYGQLTVEGESGEKERGKAVVVVVIR